MEENYTKSENVKIGVHKLNISYNLFNSIKSIPIPFIIDTTMFGDILAMPSDEKLIFHILERKIELIFTALEY